MRAKRACLRLTLAVPALLLLASCYTAGSLLPADVSSVSVEIFENLTFRRGIEVDLTDALKRQLRIKTHLRQLPRAQADSYLEGTILEVEERVLSEGKDDRVVDERVTVIVRVEWVRANGKKLVVLPRVQGWANVATGRGEDVAGGTREALADLAERIVFLLEDRNW